MGNRNNYIIGECMNRKERDIMKDKMFDELLQLVGILVENQEKIIKKLDKLEKPKPTKQTKRRLQ